MLLLAAANFVMGRKKKERGLTTSIWGELSIGVVILILSVFLTNLPTAMQSPGPFMENNKVKEGAQVTLSVTPNRIGENQFSVVLKNRQGKPIKDIEQVQLTFTMLEMDMGKETAVLKKAAEGEYQTEGLHFSMAGHWNVHVHVLTKSLESIDSDFRVMVGSQ
jgi:copper transport protein